MSDPRLGVSIVGVDAKYVRVAIDDSTITYSATTDGGSAAVGLAVTLSAAGTIELVGDAEPILGKLITVASDGYATVQYGGGMTLPGGSGATLTLGFAIIGDLGASSAEGYIRISDGATAGEIQGQRGFIWDAGTTTAVEVML